jgi:diguanylate cyclase (GGDEF)-like protein
MELHLPTLALVAVAIAAILGILLLLAWRPDQSTNALVWWGVGYMAGGASFALLAARGHIPNVLSIELANVLLLLAYGFLFEGARAFHGRETPVTIFLIAPLIWLTAMRIPAIAVDVNLRIIVVSSMQCVLVALMAYEFWHHRAEALMSRWSTIVILCVHAAVLAGRMIAVLVTPVLSEQEFLVHRGFALMAFGTVLYTITFAFLLLSMTKERSELRHKIAALIDPLTGLANRRAFMSDAEAIIARRGARREPIALLLADLDHFKKINDAFGHPAGDRVLKLFAAALTRSIDADDLVGRIGGEEFAILLAGKSEVAAFDVAERVRSAFADDAGETEGHAIGATVSIGVAATRAGAPDLVALLGRADKALYRAKAKGRNRVALFDAESEINEAPLAPSATVTPLRRRAAAG